jgi:peptide/nickel transport system permease protein
VTAAAALGRSSDLGRIEPGKLADIVVLEADPLADIQNGRRTRLVLKAGEVHETAHLRAPALAIILSLYLVALMAPVIAPRNPDQQVLLDRLKPPSLEYPFGTDRFGRDLFSRAIWATRVSLGVSLAAMLISVGIGALVGIASGFFGGWVDGAVMRVTDLFIAFPVFVLLITLVAIYGSSAVLMTIFLGLAVWPPTARIVRAEVLSMRTREFIVAARVIGTNATRVILLHMLPNVLPLIAIAATLRVAQVILIEASLSYFGLGVPPPAATWGNMVADGRSVLDSAWWITTFPGLLVVLTVLAYNLMGDGLRDVVDPRRQHLGRRATLGE